MPKSPRRDRAVLRLIGLDPTKLSAKDVATGAELARRITQCERVPGANKRRGKAVADWRSFVQHLGQQHPRKPIKCVQCGNLVPLERSTRRYCSDACRQMAYRQRTRMASLP
jgi:hypothetical protein